MISSIGTGTSNISTMLSKIFKKLDTNEDDSIDKSELQALASSGSNIDVSSILKDLDTDGNGKISKTEMEDSLKKLGDELRNRFAASAMSSMQPPDPAEMFSSIDTDGNGSIDETENAAAMSKMGPPPPPPPPDGASDDASVASSATSSTATASATGMKQSSIAQLLDALKKVDSEDEDTSAANTSIKQLLGALQSSMVYSKQAELSASTGSAQSLFSISA
jgi:Ca2+-binding EF-hand superfamily protein